MELGVTQAAVSRQIKALEDDLGLPLFRRLHRRVELTEAGATLASRLARAFNDVAGIIAELRRSAGAELVVAATLAFSQFRLLPRLSAFRLAHPDLRLRLVAQDEPVDLARDASTSRSATAWARGATARPISSTTTASCWWRAPPSSPAMVRSRARGGDRRPLIGYDVPDPTGCAGATGSPPAAGRAGTGAGFALQSLYGRDLGGLAGEGITLGWRWLVDRSWRSAPSCRSRYAQVVPDGGYYAVTPASRTPSPARSPSPGGSRARRRPRAS